MPTGCYCCMYNRFWVSAKHFNCTTKWTYNTTFQFDNF